jgi:ELWxxDGT repeat protein
MVKDINSGSNSSNPAELTLVNNTLYFTAYDSTTSATELFQSDGTNMGTLILNSNINNPELLTAVGDTLFFSAFDLIIFNDMGVLWNSDGTNSGTGIIDSNIRPLQIFSLGDLIFVINYQILDENQLVSYDGTTSIIDSGVGVENVALVGDTLFYTKNNDLHYHSSDHGNFINS